jgi:preprotein translocase subunit SecD
MRQRGLVLSLVITTVVAIGGLIGVIAAGWAPVLGLDLQGGLSVVLKPSHVTSQQSLNQTIDIIRNRVDALGVAQPNIAQQGNNIVVQLPGVKHPQKALALIGQTAQLEFRPVLCAAPPYTPPKGPPPTPGLPPACSSSATAQSTTQGAGEDPSLATVPSTPQALNQPKNTVLLPEKDQNGHVVVRYVMGPAQGSGVIIKSATAAVSNTGQWQVNFTTTSSGAAKWDRIAQQNFHKQVAIVLDNVVQSAPTIQPDQSSFSSFGGQGQITGSFSQQSAQNLALVLNYGALPVQLHQQTAQTVSPTLGKSSLEAGLVAGIAGLILVLLYIVFYYRGLGVVAFLGLALTAALLWAIVSVLGHTKSLALDLSGVTGVIVSIGITVDSYIVYFERLKDEVRAGRSIRTSVDRGFKRAYRTILAADAVSFIGALLLYLLSVGPVQGFAFFLGLSTLLDIVTAYTFTRPLVILLGRSRTFTEARWLGVAPGLAVETGAGAPPKEPVPAGSAP